MHARTIILRFVSIAVVLTGSGCQAELQRYVVRDDLPGIPGARVYSVRLNDGRAVRLDSSRSTVRSDGERLISGRTVDGDSVDVPFDQVAEADVRVTEPSVAGTWFVVAAIFVGAGMLLLSGLSAH